MGAGIHTSRPQHSRKDSLQRDLPLRSLTRECTQKHEACGAKAYEDRCVYQYLLLPRPRGCSPSIAGKSFAIAVCVKK